MPSTRHPSERLAHQFALVVCLNLPSSVIHRQEEPPRGIDVPNYSRQCLDPCLPVHGLFVTTNYSEQPDSGLIRWLGDTVPPLYITGVFTHARANRQAPLRRRLATSPREQRCARILLTAFAEMEPQRPSKESLSGGSTSDPAEYKPEPICANTSSHLLPQNPPANNDPLPMPDVTLKAKTLMIVPLVVHFLGSLAIVLVILFWLDKRAFHTNRSPKVILADGTEISDHLGRHNIVQSDVVTILSGALMLLRWVASAWAGPLCWRTVFLLAEKQGVRHQDIRWITSVGFLPPSRHFRHFSTLLITLILVLSLLPFPASPLLTGSITWVPGNKTLDDSSINYTIRYTGASGSSVLPPDSGAIIIAGGSYAFLHTHVIRTHYLAWSQKGNDDVIKRVTSSVANLSIGSTVRDITLPYLNVTQLDWLSVPENETDIHQKLYSMQKNSGIYPSLLEKLSQPGAAALIDIVDEPVRPRIVTLLFNVVQSGSDDSAFGVSTRCENSTLITQNTAIPSFNLAFEFEAVRGEPKVDYTSCFAYAKMTLVAGDGYCRRCRVTSYSTVQNETALDPPQSATGGPPSFDSTSALVTIVLSSLPQYLPTLTPFKDSLPDPIAKGLEAYARALLTRSFSAVWTALTDSTGYDSPTPMMMSYDPAYPTLKAEVDEARVKAWLALQLSATVAGLLFLWLQASSHCPLYTDTRMVAFDLDTSEISVPNASNKKEVEKMLGFRWSGDRWKAIVTRRKIGEGE